MPITPLPSSTPSEQTLAFLPFLNVGHSVTDLDDRLYGRPPPTRSRKDGLSES